jgi:aerobic-type carbon monoxide dehydrogenase small subunit (CoxS/CutS family)
VKYSISVQVNGVDYRGEVEPRTLLSDFIRHDLGLHGTRVGCEHGVCGACTVQLAGEPVRSCLMLAMQADGEVIRTIEGIGSEDDLHPLQAAFQEKHALQCGFCTPGVIITLEAFLREHPEPTEAETRAALSANLCRCTGYRAMLEAVQSVTQRTGTRTNQCD